jgi:hypothetical protein
MKFRLLLLGSALGVTVMFGAAQASEQTFAKPKAGPFRIDWCYLLGSQCGKPAADRFCQSKGFVQSNDFEEAVDIGASTPTIVQGTGQSCAAPGCDGFTYVTCEKPDAPPPPPPPPPGGGGANERTYYKPKLGGYRVNYCETKGIGCGQDAADSFCDAKGYDDASDFAQSAPVPPGAKPTRFIGNGKICKGPGCYGFNSITCENQP